MGKPLAKEFTDRIYQPGNPGGPGRPKGSRSKLQEAVIRALYENFAINGADAIEKVRLRKPEVYLMACVSLLPKQAQKVESPFVDVSDAEIEALEQHLSVVRAKMVNQIEATAEPASRVADEAPEANGQGIRENGAHLAPDHPTAPREYPVSLSAEQPVLPLDVPDTDAA